MNHIRICNKNWNSIILDNKGFTVFLKMKWSYNEYFISLIYGEDCINERTVQKWTI